MRKMTKNYFLQMVMVAMIFLIGCYPIQPEEPEHEVTIMQMERPPQRIMPDSGFPTFPASWGDLIWSSDFPDSSSIEKIGTFTNEPWYWVIAWKDGSMTYMTDHKYNGTNY